MNNPFENRNLTETLKWPWLSWSSYNAFTSYDKEKWYDQYVLGNRSASNPAMEAGRVIGERLATDPTYLPAVPRPEIYEQELKGKLHRIFLVGHLDGWSPSIPAIHEYKTTQNKGKWTKESVAEHGQIDFYCLLVWLNFKIPPEKLELSLTSIQLKESGSFALEPTGEVTVIPTQRTMKDILLFASNLKRAYNDMTAFVEQKEPDRLCPYCKGKLIPSWRFCNKRECCVKAKKDMKVKREEKADKRIAALMDLR